MSQKLPVNGFKWVKKLSRFNEIFIKNYNEKNNAGYFPKVEYLLRKIFRKNYLNFIKIYYFYPTVEKLICSMEDKEKYLIQIRVLKQALNHELVLQKVHREIQFNQKN